MKKFKDRHAEALFSGALARKLPADIQRRARMRLDRIMSAARLEDLRQPPSHRLEKLQGDREGQHSIRINDQWRICFIWDGTTAWNIEITDYH